MAPQAGSPYPCRMTIARRCLTAIALLLAAANAGMAEENALPGVSVDRPIVGEMPPEPGDHPDDPGSFRIGDTDVRISGSVTVDVTVGDLRPRPNR